MNTLTLDRPLDMHLHLRQGDMLRGVAPLSADTFAAAIIMPNLVPPVDSRDAVLRYRDDILAAVTPRNFMPLMTLFFRDYTRAELEAVRNDITAIKLYPDGVTTNSQSGIRDLFDYHDVFAIMQELDIPLLVHGETHGFVMDREKEFLSVYDRLARTFPTLRIVMEHITTADAVTLLDRHEHLYATVTLHHLLITLDDVAGGQLRPHLFCKPIAKRPEDREALLGAVLAGHSKLVFGSDSAPHPVSAKEACGCAAGVFTAPHALAHLAELFDRHHALDRLQAFVSDISRANYRINPPAKTVTLTRTPSTIPDRYGEVVPFRAGETCSWSVTGIA
jgi:dihydroorotase